MSDTNNVADTYGGGEHRRKTPFPMPAQVRPVPTFGAEPEGDPGVISDSSRIVDQLKTTMQREVGTINRPNVATPASISSPLKEIAQRIKKLVHDDGEQMGDELKAKITDGVSVAKALQVWADDTLREKEKSPA